MKALNECVDNESGNKIIFSKKEKGKTFALKLNSNETFACEVIDVDKCVFKDVEIRRSDWLFLVPNKDKVTNRAKAFFIELKGNNIDEASEQLYNAIDRMKGQIHNFDIEARVVSPRGPQPAIQNSGYYKKVRKIIKKDIEFCKVHKGNNFTHIENI
ncbi:MAG: hypothetical protein K0Q79_2448 [Flavipsychrobacter sp.]|jgi:hypothetical protein|nr:hypothetical protein [Flavipsychrobacter sp.]